ncbi:hypothetical protein [Streptomyces sp. enrichment culture]|uniref:hypothetical protein n=1 Tax=Streptomyces sp. enrichment culture TaxID=1795815 RepID=UPI003F54C76A
MARNIGADGRTVYRAVITSTSPNSRPSTWYEGPYSKPGTARARIAFWRGYLARSGSTAEGHVEQAHTIWAPLDGKEQRPAERAAAAIRAQAYRDAAADIETQLRAEGYALDCACESCTPCLLRDYPAMLRARADAIHPAPQEPTP